jgi:transcriptional regulator with XRE-family HTH domain
MMGKKRRKGGVDLVEQLKEAVRGSGLSLSRLGVQSGVDVSQLSRFMRGESNLSLVSAGRVCRALGLGLAPVGKPRGKKGKEKGEG